MHRKISEGAALLALALLNLADDEGRFEADPAQIQAHFFSRRPLSRPIEEALQELATRTDWLVLYTAPVDGEETQLGQIVNFRRHQVVNKPRRSNLPPPPNGTLRDTYGSDTGALPPPNTDGSEHGQGSDTVALLGSMEGRKGKEGRKEETRPPNFPEVAWPTEAEVLAEGAMRSIPPALCSKFWRHYETKSPRWTVKGDVIGNWRLKLWDWWQTDQQKNPAQKNAPEKSELNDIRAELQWQKDPARIEWLKKRRRELGGE